MQPELLKQYIESLGKRLERINSLLDKLVSGNSKAIENIRLLAHSLAGSGASFGFPEISESGKTVELASDEELEQKLRELKAVIEKVLAETDVGIDEPAVQAKDSSPGQTEPRSSSEKEKPAKKAEKSATNKPLKILIVDDDPEITALITNTLKELPKKQKIFVAETAARAQELFVKDIYDLIIMDLMLPDRDGRELIKEIKLEFSLPSPLLVLSSVRNDSVRVECISIGADKFLLKPFYEADLLHEAKKLLGKKVVKKLSLVPLDGEVIEEEDDEEDDDSPKILEGFNVLVAEDDKMQAALIQQKLIGEGAAVEIASNGREAMQLLRTRGFSLIILDIQMPIMDGFEVMQRIKDELKLDTPVIMVTAMGDEEDIIKGYDLGATDYILKPFSDVQLIARVKSLLKSSKDC